MAAPLWLPRPRILPPLDEGFCPAALAHEAYLRSVNDSGTGVPLVLGLERADGALSRFEIEVFPDSHAGARAGLFHVERMVKFLLWQRGCWRLYVGGPGGIGRYLHTIYSPGGDRSFDADMLGNRIYQRGFTVVVCKAEEVPSEAGRSRLLGRHWEGCRIGFDLGASDLKVSAVVDGEVVYHKEMVWDPSIHIDPGYHYEWIVSALRQAVARLPHLDAIGGSAAGVYVDNKPMVASLFRSVPESRYDQVLSLFSRIGAQFGVPIQVINDGDVTALAGSMSLQESGLPGSNILGIALGSSEAAGYVDATGSITGWLNELAFAPIDYGPEASVEGWSRDRGVGARYLSQQCVFRLAPAAGIDLPSSVAKAEMLQAVQDKLESGHPGAVRIWQSIGVYLGYALAHYASFYDLKQVLILGRCTSGSGGELILSGAREILHTEFPRLADQINIRLPDELTRRMGQSIAAASLPALNSSAEPAIQGEPGPGTPAHFQGVSA